MRDASSQSQSQSPLDPIPDLILERYLLGELPEGARLRVEMRVGSDPALRARLEALRDSDAEILADHAPEAMARATRERLRREAVEASYRKGKARGFGLAWRFDLSGRATGVLVGACLLAVIAVPVWRAMNDARDVRSVGAQANAQASSTEPTETEARGGNTSGAAPEASISDSTSSNSKHENATPETRRAESADKSPINEPMTLAQAEVDPDPRAASDTRIKGLEPALALFRKTREGSEPLRPGAKARTGDVLRIGYRAAGGAFGAIFSVDGNGNVTRHWPTAGDRAVRLERGEALLPGAFELDAAPDYERFYLLTSERPFDLKAVLESLHDEKRSFPIPGIRTFRFELLKDDGT